MLSGFTGKVDSSGFWGEEQIKMASIQEKNRLS